jgi:hypothetical protein
MHDHWKVTSVVAFRNQLPNARRIPSRRYLQPALGCLRRSSVFSATASAGMSSAVSGEITRSPASSRRTRPSPATRVCSSSPSAWCNSPTTAASSASAVAGLPASRQNSGPPPGPSGRGEQVGGRVGVAARAWNPHISAAQPVPQRQQHAQFPVVPVGGHVPGLGRGLQVAAPAGRHEPRRRVVGDLAGAAGVHSRKTSIVFSSSVAAVLPAKGTASITCGVNCRRYP